MDGLERVGNIKGKEIAIHHEKVYTYQDDSCRPLQSGDFCFVRHRKGEVWERTKSI